MSGRVEGKVALVTGAASGLGAAAVAALAREGAAVAVTDVDADAAVSVTEELAGTGAIALRLDVTDEGEWASAVAEVRTRFGCLDVLVNNAGIASGGATLLETDYAAWRRVLSVNLDGVYLGMRAAIPLMAEGGGGSIVNISSIYGIVGAAGSATYCASKGGVRLLTKATALECAADGSGVRVNSIHPGYVETPLTEPRLADPDFRSMIQNRHPIGRLGQPADIAPAMVYLASDESSFVTGSEIVVDGGFTAR